MVTGIDAGLDLRGLDEAAQARIVAALPDDAAAVAAQVREGGFVHSDDVADLGEYGVMRLYVAVMPELTGLARQEFRKYLHNLRRSDR